ncbi:MAG: nuclear transport factor 2 family protein [Rhodothermales bacterium]
MHRLLLLALTLVLAAPAAAQSPEDDARAVIDRMFDGMRSGDSTMVRSVFHSDARLMTTFTREGKPMLQTGSIDGFVKAVGTPHDEVWDERIWDVEINVDDNLASAWMKYAFYLGNTFSHCGVNAFQLAKTESGWKVIQVADTRRAVACGGER